MVFSSLVFLCIFLPVTLMLYFVVKNQAYRNGLLIITSLLFYAWGEPIWVTILIFSAMTDYFHALLVEKYRGSWQSKAALASSMILNISLLGFFKYWSFIVQNINLAFGLNLPYSNFHLPIGISFYTFQTISYVIDVYRGEVAAQKSPFKLLLFVSLFPQLVAGPILRYKDIAREIDHRTATLAGFSAGVSRFVTGLGKKVVFANTAGEISEFFLKGNVAGLPVLGAWFGIALFALQIYFDFSGYSDMAIGLGKMFGFNYKENFDYPYISRSATEFWRRWHMTLGSFFKDYVYIPLGGNRKNPVRNLFVVWFLTGLWHGASWNFIVWGLYYGLLIFVERKVLLKVFGAIPRWVSHVYFFVTMLIGWVFFYFTDLRIGLRFLGTMFGLGADKLTNAEFLIHFENNVLFFVLAIIACFPVKKLLQVWVERLTHQKRAAGLVVNGIVRPAFEFTVLLISIILLVGKTYNPFLYFRF